MNSKVTAAEARTLARAFQGASKSVASYRTANWDSLGEEERERLEVTAWGLLNISSRMTTEGVRGALAGVKVDLENLEGTVRGAAKRLETVREVKRVLSLAGSLLTLCGALASGQPGKAGRALSVLIRALARGARGPGGESRK